MNNSDVNRLDKIYFNKIKKIIESNGTTFFKNLTSHFDIEESWNNYSGKMSYIQEGVERVVQSIISDNVDWDICSTPVGADSVFMTPKAVIHIDSKALLYSDGDAVENKVTLSKNQTSYMTNNEYVYGDSSFKSNLPCCYDHKLYGEVVCLTYFVKVIYDLREGLNSFRNFKVILCSIPNGELSDIYGYEFVQAGRSIIRVIQPQLNEEQFSDILERCQGEEINTLNNSYNVFDIDGEV
ncbi:MAG: hypothetical protein ACRDD7_15695, partial [Peptostreptococcaceae bacterium]